MSEASPGNGSTPRLRLRITSEAAAALRAGHPWLFADSIREQNRPGLPGELAVIYDGKNRLVGLGLFDPESPLRARMLHTGKPCPLDADWWRRRLAEALERRRGLFDAATTGYRCCNGESDGWPGWVLDRYDTTLVIKLYTAAWLPWLAGLLDLVDEQLPNERVVLRLSRNVQPLAERFEPPREAVPPLLAGPLSDGQILRGAPLDGPVIFRETGLRFEADVLRGQKTGFFLDQRENRRRVEALAAGRAVLNAFSFSGGFSVYAARGGAASVTDVDISAHALDGARRNLALNRENAAVRGCLHETVQADVFDWLRDGSGTRFDLVVIDPPSLARRESQRPEALRAYQRLARSGIERLRPGGILVAASCSAHVAAAEFFGAVRRSARSSGRRFRELETTGHPADHPATFPEAEYLKCIYLRLD